MPDESSSSFWDSMPKILGGIAAIITAVGGLYVALNNNDGGETQPTKPPETSQVDVVEFEAQDAGNGAVELQWRVNGVKRLFLTGEPGPVAPMGRSTDKPTKTTTYVLSYDDPNGERLPLAQVEVVVERKTTPAGEMVLKLSPQTVQRLNMSRLRPGGN